MLSLITAFLQFTDTGKAIFKLLLAAGTLIAVLGAIIYNVSDLPAAINAVTTRIYGVTAFVQAAPTAAVMAKVNRFFPLSELCVFVAAWLALYGLALVVRVVRSFIPTMGG